MGKNNTSPPKTKYLKVLTVENDQGQEVKIGIINAKGRHVIKAQNIMDGDSSKWFPALMHVVCRVDDQPQPLEYYEDLPMKGFMALMVEIGGEGFIG